VITTARLVLRPFRPADAPTLGAVLAANQAHLVRDLPGEAGKRYDLESMRRRIARFERQWRNGRAWHFGIWTDGLVGAIGVAAGTPGRCELGYWLAAGARGAGFASEAAAAIVDFAHGTLGFDVVEVVTAHDNAKSAAIPARLGFAIERRTADTTVWRG
jgi:RimJ/RimL family protein N-acetyltransferase